MTSLSPTERRLLLGLITDPSRLARAELLDLGVRWTHLGAVALAHRVAPLVSRGFRALGAGAHLPPEAARLRDQCHAVYVHTAASNTRMLAEVGRIVPPLQRAGIPVILLKGAAVAGTLFGDLGLRYMGDVDLLVPIDARARAWDALESLGYHLVPGAPADLRARARRAGLLPARPGPLSRELSARIYERFHLHYYLMRDGQPFPVELHWHIVKPGRGVHIEDLWRRAQPVRAGGIHALAFAPEHLLLHFALHLALDDYGELTLARLVDVHMAAADPALDWVALRRAADVHSARRAVGVALDLSRRVLGTPIPATCRDLLGPMDRVLSARLAAHWLAALAPRPGRRERFGSTVAWAILRRDRWASVAGRLYRRLVSYPELNPHLPERFRGSELLNLVHALRPARFAALGRRARAGRPARPAVSPAVSEDAQLAGVPPSQ